MLKQKRTCSYKFGKSCRLAVWDDAKRGVCWKIFGVYRKLTPAQKEEMAFRLSQHVSLTHDETYALLWNN